ncbi:hypothetical protein ACFQW6_07365 [Nocardioides sp. GCM10028917]|uniref:hypothetical protein n=1 Tax=Nocardioides sp. GCM10028917 TaxID=3273408 RepID=UPI00360980AA
MNSTNNLDVAADLTRQLSAIVPVNDGDFDAVWLASEGALQRLQTDGYAPDEFLPDEVSDQMNFNLPGRDLALRFYRAYVREVRKAVCGGDQEFRSSIDNALTAGAGALLTVLAGGLAVPAAAVVLLAPIGAVLLVKGVDAFCALEPLPDEADEH